MDIVNELDITLALLNALNLSFDHTWQDVEKIAGYIIAYVSDDEYSISFEHSVDCLMRYGKANTPPGMMYTHEEDPDMYFIAYNGKLLQLETNSEIIKYTGEDHFVLENSHGEHLYNIEEKEKYVPPNNIIISITAAGIELEEGIYISKTRKLIYYWPGHGDPTDMFVRNIDYSNKYTGWRKFSVDYSLSKTCDIYDEGLTQLVEREPRSLTKPVFFIRSKEEMLARYDEIMSHFR
jgi:hypothetical protein